MKSLTFSPVASCILLTALILLVLPIFSSLSAQEQEKNTPTKHRLALAHPRHQSIFPRRIDAALRKHPLS